MHTAQSEISVQNKYELTLCQSRFHTASETFVHHKTIRIGFNFLHFCIHSKHFDRKGWRIRKNRIWKFRTQCASTFSSLTFSSVCVKHKVLAHWVRNFHIRFFVVFVILSYQNACYGCENAENRTRSEFFYDGRKFRRQCGNVIDTMWARIYFLKCENFGQKCPTVQCAVALKENATVFPYSNMFFPQLRRVDMYLSRLSPCT